MSTVGQVWVHKENRSQKQYQIWRQRSRDHSSEESRDQLTAKKCNTSLTQWESAWRYGSWKEGVRSRRTDWEDLWEVRKTLCNVQHEGIVPEEWAKLEEWPSTRWSWEQLQDIYLDIGKQPSQEGVQLQLKAGRETRNKCSRKDRKIQEGLGISN